MANRVVREGILDSERVNKLSWAGEVFYRRLMSMADDYGRGDGRISIIRSKLYPLKWETVTEANILEWIQECIAAGLLNLYSVGEKPYFEIIDFNQTLRIKKSRYPENPSSSNNQEQNHTEKAKQGNIIDIWLADLPNSQEIERMAMLYKVGKDKIIAKIPAFRLKAELAYPNHDKFLNHFKNWYLKTMGDSGSGTGKKRNTLT